MRHRDTGILPVPMAWRFQSASVWFFLLFLSLVSCGCNSLATGEIASLHASSTPVVLIRGWRDLWSEGLDRLSDKLKQEGIASAVFKESQSGDVSAEILSRAKVGSLPRPIILIGFSYGADDVIDISRKLNDVHQSVDLLILIDPVTPAPIPANVKRCVNYYQSNGVWDAFPWLRGVPATAAAGTPGIVNINLRDRPDLLEAGTSHKTIAGNAKVHAAILAEVRAARAR